MSKQKDLLERIRRITNNPTSSPANLNTQKSDASKYISKRKGKDDTDRATGKAKVYSMETEEVINKMGKIIAEVKKLSPKALAAMPKKEREAYKLGQKHYKAQHDATRKTNKAAPKKPVEQKKTEPEMKVDDRSVGEKLLDSHKKGTIHMGTVRKISSKMQPLHAGEFQRHLADNPHYHESFKRDPEAYANAWLHGVKQRPSAPNPGKFPSLGGSAGFQSKLK